LNLVEENINSLTENVKNVLIETATKIIIKKEENNETLDARRLV
jgi:hypothetical protein